MILLDQSIWEEYILIEILSLKRMKRIQKISEEIDDISYYLNMFILTRNNFMLQ